jgi:hypothetical protein
VHAAIEGDAFHGGVVDLLELSNAQREFSSVGEPIAELRGIRRVQTVPQHSVTRRRYELTRNPRF